MLAAILIIGFLLIAVALKIAKGVLKIVLVVILLILIAGGSVVSTNHTEVVPVSSNL